MRANARGAHASCTRGRNKQSSVQSVIAIPCTGYDKAPVVMGEQMVPGGSGQVRPCTSWRRRRAVATAAGREAHASESLRGRVGSLACSTLRRRIEYSGASKRGFESDRKKTREREGGRGRESCQCSEWQMRQVVNDKMTDGQRLIEDTPSGDRACAHRLSTSMTT